MSTIIWMECLSTSILCGANDDTSVHFASMVCQLLSPVIPCPNDYPPVIFSPLADNVTLPRHTVTSHNSLFIEVGINTLQ